MKTRTHHFTDHEFLYILAGLKVWAHNLKVLADKLDPFSDAYICLVRDQMEVNKVIDKLKQKERIPNDTVNIPSGS